MPGRLAAIALVDLVLASLDPCDHQRRGAELLGERCLHQPEPGATHEASRIDLGFPRDFLTAGFTAKVIDGNVAGRIVRRGTLAEPTTRV